MAEANIAGRVRRIEVYRLPMTMTFRRVDKRTGVLIWGDLGVGEWSPFAEYDDDESASWLAAALEAADIGYPPKRHSTIPVNCTVPAVAPDTAAKIVAESHGCTTAKVKVAEPGQHLDDDVARVSAVRDELGPGGRIRIDANGGWSVREAIDGIGVLSEFGLEYVEQPVALTTEMATVRRRVGVPIAADESIRRSGDPERVKRLGAADIAVLKVQPLGGVAACLDLAERLAMPVVVSSALESSVGLAAGVALASTLPTLEYACGLATMTMLERDLVVDPFQVVDGRLVVRRPQPSEQAIVAARADSATTTWWLDRLSRCLARLARRA